MKLFNFFKKKPQYTQLVALNDEEREIDALDLSWVSDHIEESDNYPRINWDKITCIVESEHAKYDKPRLWNNIVKTWLNRLKEKLPKGNNIHESDHFILLSSENDKYINLYLKFLERSYKKILSSLHGIASENSRGKYIVIIIDDIDSYYAYISHYYPAEGEFAMSAGVFLNDGYGHFGFPHQTLSIAEAVSAHELTHAMVSHLPIPLWLNEGLAVNMESIITGYTNHRLTKEKHHKHLNFWQEKEVQQFWSGKSFARPDEANELSYHLAQLAVSSLSEDYPSFVSFVNQANYLDGGELAAMKVYGGSLGAIIEGFFGEGDWSPKLLEDKMTEKADF